MGKEKYLMSFLNDVVANFGFIILMVAISAMLVGEFAKDVSSVFTLGDIGLSLNTILQFFVFSFFTTTINRVFLSDLIIKNLSSIKRVMYMSISICIIAFVFIFIFNWFPINMIGAWITFLTLSFICIMCATIITFRKEQNYNKKMEQALEEFNNKYE